MSEVLNNKKGGDIKKEAYSRRGRGRLYIFEEDVLLDIIEKIFSAIILLLALLSTERVIRIDGKFKEEEFVRII